MKEECVFLFLFQPFQCKAYFPALSQMEKNKLPTWNQRAWPGGPRVSVSWLCPTTVLWGQCGA